MKKTSWKHHHFKQVHHKSKSYDFWFLRYWLRWTDFFFLILDQFCRFTLTMVWKIKFEKMKRTSGDITLHLCNKNHDMTEVRFLSSNNLKTQNFEKIKKNTCRYHYFTPVCQKFWLYDLQFLRYEAWQTEIDNFGSFFFPFTALKTKKIKILKKLKNIAGDIIILQMCTKNHDHMMYGYWDSEWDGQNFFVILGQFLPFYPTKRTQKIETLKRWEKTLGEIILEELYIKWSSFMVDMGHV